MDLSVPWTKTVTGNYAPAIMVAMFASFVVYVLAFVVWIRLASVNFYKQLKPIVKWRHMVRYYSRRVQQPAELLLLSSGVMAFVFCSQVWYMSLAHVDVHPDNWGDYCGVLVSCSLQSCIHLAIAVWSSIVIFRCCSNQARISWLAE